MNKYLVLALTEFRDSGRCAAVKPWLYELESASPLEDFAFHLAHHGFKTGDAQRIIMPAAILSVTLAKES